MTREKKPSPIASRKKLTIAAFVALGILLAGLALVGVYDVYQNHIARDCGAECGTPPSGGAVQGGF